MDQGISFYQALEQADQISTLGRAAAKLEAFVSFIRRLRSQGEFYSVQELLQQIIDDTGYVEELKAEDTEEAQARIENIDELFTKAATYEESAEEPTLSGFLEEIALVADIDSVDENDDRVLLSDTSQCEKDWNSPMFIWLEWRTAYSRAT